MTWRDDPGHPPGPPEVVTLIGGPLDGARWALRRRGQRVVWIAVTPDARPCPYHEYAPDAAGKWRHRGHRFFPE